MPLYKLYLVSGAAAVPFILLLDLDFLVAFFVFRTRFPYD